MEDFSRTFSEEILLKYFAKSSNGMLARSMEMAGCKNLSQNFRHVDREEPFKSWLINGEDNGNNSSSIAHHTWQTSRRMAEAKDRNLMLAIPSDMQSVLERCENLEKEVRSIKLNLSFVNRKDSEQTKQIEEELQQKNEELVDEKERLLEEIERIVSESEKMC